MPQEIQQFAERQIRTYWDDAEEKYYFCIIDAVEALTDSKDPKQYIKRMRQRDPELNSVWGTICTPHQFISSDGKRHQANCASLDGIFRIIQSISSPKAEPFKSFDKPVLSPVEVLRINSLHNVIHIYSQAC